MSSRTISVTGECKGMRLEKKTYLSGVEIKGSCPECGAEYVHNCGTEHFNYPAVGYPESITGYCRVCGHEWKMGDVVIRISVEPFRASVEPSITPESRTAMTDADLDALEVMVREELTSCALCADVATVRCKDCKTIMCDGCSSGFPNGTCSHGVEPIVQRWSIALRAVEELRALRALTKPPAFSIGDVFRHRRDGDLCQIESRVGIDAWHTRLHDGSFGSMRGEDFKNWLRVGRGLSHEAFRAMHCTCSRCAALAPSPTSPLAAGDVLRRNADGHICAIYKRLDDVTFAIRFHDWTIQSMTAAKLTEECTRVERGAGLARFYEMRCPCAVCIENDASKGQGIA